MSEEERNIWNEQLDRVKDSLERACDRFSRWKKYYLGSVIANSVFSISTIQAGHDTTLAIVSTSLGFIIIMAWVFDTNKQVNSTDYNITMMLEIEEKLNIAFKINLEIRNGTERKYHLYRLTVLDRCLPYFIMVIHVGILVYCISL